MEKYAPERINFLLRCMRYLEENAIMWFRFAKRYGVSYEEWNASI